MLGLSYKVVRNRLGLKRMAHLSPERFSSSNPFSCFPRESILLRLRPCFQLQALRRQAPMARNIEIKARIESVESIAPKAAAIANAGPIEITQDDSFFRCEAGRLKLRTFSADNGELIFYRRASQLGPAESFYVRSPTSAPETLRDLLSIAYGQVGRVRKQRTLFLVGRTRLHLDKVEELGHFLELEVPLAEGEPAEVGVREAEKIMQKLEIKPTRLIEGAYVDLLANKASNLD
jgi:adenylate cyclase class IV